jgi:hypothetical protein
MTARYVILRHDHPEVHWDFMLEREGVLRTWRLPTPPMPGTMEAVALPDHRLAYLDYEGPVSGGRGAVACWDRGVYELLEATADGGQARLIGDVLRALASWRRVEGTRWQFEFRDLAPW